MVIIFYYIFVVVLIFGGLLFIRKYLMKNVQKLGGVKSGAYIKIIDRLAVTQDKHIILLETGNKILVVGVSPQKIEAITEFTKEEFGELAGGADDTGAENGGFLHLLNKKLNFGDGGKSDKNEKSEK